MGGVANSRKHVSLISLTRLGRRTFELIGPGGKAISSFDLLAHKLRTSPYNTREKYCSAAADFFDYFFEAVLHITDVEGQENLSKAQLRDVIFAWKSYLVDGVASDNPLASKVAATLRVELVSDGTAAIKHAALTHLLRLSERVRQQTVDFESLGLLAAESDYEPLLLELVQLRAIGNAERAEMRRTSMMAGVTSGGSGMRPQAIFTAVPIPKYDTRSAFPLERFEEFLSVVPSFRDKALYSFEAASGCRGHEALQLLWEDIDIGKGEVCLISPYSRPKHSSYLQLTSLERDSLAWKGRETINTFLIEPFASMFFENLEKYHREEYFPHGRHQFVFQILRRPDQGRPYFLTHSSTRQQAFQTAARKIGLPEEVDGPHSLRHGYGTYMVNYLPLANGEFGMPMGLVRVAMGHAAITSTEKYAVLDQDLVRARVQFANLKVFHRGETAGQLQFKMRALQGQINKLEAIAAGIKR